MAFLMILLRIFCRIVRVRDRSDRNITVLQNYFPVNLARPSETPRRSRFVANVGWNVL
jgi:hypothetical protein